MTIDPLTAKIEQTNRPSPQTGQPAKIPELERLASERIGGNKTPRLYFVTDRGVVVTVTRDRATALAHYTHLANRSPLAECAMEQTDYGVVHSVEPESDEPGAKLIRL